MIEDQLATLARLPLFAGFPNSCLIDIAQASRWIAVTSGEVLFRQGDQAKGFYQVLSGQIKVAIASDEGDEKVMEIYSQGEGFGLAELLDAAPCVTYAQAVADSNLFFIGRDGVVQAIATEPLLASRMLKYLAERLHRLERDVASYCFHSGCRRVLGFLLQQPSTTIEGGTMVDLNTSKGLIASRLGMTPESFSRALHDLSTAGLIAVTGKQVTLQAALVARHIARSRGEQASIEAATRNRRRADANADRTVPNRPIGSRAWI